MFRALSHSTYSFLLPAAFPKQEGSAVDRDWAEAGRDSVPPISSAEGS